VRGEQERYFIFPSVCGFSALRAEKPHTRRSARTLLPQAECGYGRALNQKRKVPLCNVHHKKERKMIYAYVLIEAEPTRVQDLIKELPDMELDGSVIKQVHAVTGRYDLIAFVESPDMQSLGN